MINDKFEPQKIGKKKLPKFKGHVKLTLKDAKTGEVQQVVEGDNIVTNALSDLINECNYFGCLDYNKVMPLWSKWFAGALLYAQPFPVDELTEELDPNDYYIKNNSVNAVVGHAGDVYATDIRDDPKRGSPNTYLQKRTPNSYTAAFEFGPTQSNGEISAIALTHKDVGNCGTGSNSNAFKTFEPFDLVHASNIGAMPTYIEGDGGTASPKTRRIDGQFDEHWGFTAYVGELGQEYVITSDLKNKYATTFEFRRYAFNDTGLQDSNQPNLWTYLTVYHNNFNWWLKTPSCSWDQKNKNLWIFANYTDNHHQDYGIYFWCMKFHITYTEGLGFGINWTYWNITPNEDIIGYFGDKGYIPHQTKIVNGVEQDIFYFPYYDSSNHRTDPRKMVKFNFQNQADYEVVSVMSSAKMDIQNKMHTHMCGETSDDLLVNFGYVMNDGVGYPCKCQYGETYSGSGVFYQPNVTQPSKIVTFASRNANNGGNQLLANKMVHTTKFNLPSSVMKTASQTMELEYTITEVEDDG